ncbi:MAG: sigma-70 family RNA polymerase sigma factor [Planctomycetota bacterium]
MPDDPSFRNELEARRRGLTRLARTLVRDRATAEDLVQETFLAALRADRSRVRAWGPWLEAVLRRLAWRYHRAEGRRQAHERWAAAGESDHLGAQELPGVDPAPLRRAVDRLREPYRSTLRLHYLEGRSAAEIAREARVPVKTVYTRLSRGTERLRAMLTRRPRRPGLRGLLGAWLRRALGGRRRAATRAAWLGAALGAVLVAPLVLAPAGPGTEVAGVKPEAPSDGLVPSAVERVARLERRGATAPPAAEAAPARTPRAPNDPGTASALAATQRPAAWTGRVLNARGQPRAGVPIWFEAGAPGGSPERPFYFLPVGPPPLFRGRSAADGSYRVHVPAGSFGRLVARGAGVEAVTAVLLGERPPTPSDLFVAPALALEGAAADPLGTPIAGATIRFVPPAALVLELASGRSDVMFTAPAARTDELGRFTLRRCYHASGGAQLSAERPGAAPHGVAVASGTREVAIVLTAPPDRRVAGAVVDGNGRPVASALVALGERWCRSSGDGSFELTPPASGRLRLRAFAAGRRPVELTLPRADDRERSLHDVRVVLDRGTLAISGRVLDARGAPYPGVRVFPGDRTPVEIQGLPALFEEELVRPRAGSPLMDTATDGEGRFVLTGLLERPYRVGAIDPTTLIAAWSEPVDAGVGDLALVLPRTEPGAVRRGRTVARDGSAVGGVQVVPLRFVLSVPLPSGVTFVHPVLGPRVLSDAEGRFELPAALGSDASLQVSGAGVFVLEMPIPAAPPGEPFTLVVPRTVRLEARVPEGASDGISYRLYDARGVVLPVFVVHENAAGVQRKRRGRVTAEGGELPAVLAPDTAVELRLYRGDDEVSRRALDLRPGETHRLAL